MPKWSNRAESTLASLGFSLNLRRDHQCDIPVLHSGSLNPNLPYETSPPPKMMFLSLLAYFDERRPVLLVVIDEVR